jgi:hypothetical protein
MLRSVHRRFSVLLVALVLGAVTSSGCVMSPRTAHGIGNFAAAALWTAAIAGHIAVLAHHDAHYHHHHCGHYRRWHSGRWVYYYGGHWEYYDGGSWYYYED